MSRSALIHGLVYTVLVAGLAVRSRPTLPGDAGEYVAYALAFSHGHGPSLTPANLDEIRRDLSAIDPAFRTWDLESRGMPAGPGRIEFVHFWLYPALATPAVWAARVIGADPRIGFTVLNIVLLAAGFVVGRRRLSAAAAWLIFAGPILWWSDKAHPEVLVVSLITIACLEYTTRPWLAWASLGIVAAQVPVMAVFFPLLGIGSVFHRSDETPARRSVMAFAVGCGLAALPAMYYLSRFGTPTLLATAAHAHVPSWAEITTVLADLNLGLVPNWPIFTLVVLGACFVAMRSRSGRLPLAITLIGATAVIVACAQIGNFTHGGTPGVMRYAIWLVPTAVPVLGAAMISGVWRACVVAAALISVPWSIASYRPAVPEFAYRPTAIARWVWATHPSWSRPLPDVFANVLAARELPVWTDTCGKVLLIGRGDAQGMWPRPCAPAPVPESCRVPAALCYANRVGGDYTFQRLDGTVEPLKYTPQIVWRPAGETAVRAAMDRVRWWTMTPVDRHASTGEVRAAEHVRVEYTFEGDGRLIAVLTESEPGARVLLHTPRGTDAEVVDADTGEVLDRPVLGGPAVETWSLDVPANRRVLVLAIGTHDAGAAP